jgi:hypothetical protein
MVVGLSLAVVLATASTALAQRKPSAASQTTAAKTSVSDETRKARLAAVK